MQCLLVDDDPDDQEIFLLCMGQVRPEVKCQVLDSGVDALEKFQDDENFKPDIIFLDVNMPKMNGLDCLTELKTIPRLDNSCIYIYSTTSEIAVVQKAKELGANDYVMKLPNISQLKEKLGKVVDTCQHTTAKRNSR